MPSPKKPEKEAPEGLTVEMPGTLAEDASAVETVEKAVEYLSDSLAKNFVEVLNLTADQNINGEVFMQLTVKATFERGQLKALDFGGRNTKHHVTQGDGGTIVHTRRLEAGQ